MEPLLTWIDFTSKDGDRMRRVLDLFQERGTMDELGLGSIRDTLSYALFPGTSTLQTRLRYVLFIPWIYKGLEAKNVSSAAVAAEARKAQIELVGPLVKNADNGGVFGSRAQGSLDRLPSMAYWVALVRWGLFQSRHSLSWYHSSFRQLSDVRGDLGATDDPGLKLTRQPAWHPRLPPIPEGFPGVADLALTRHEAEFLKGRLEESCQGTLLGWLAREGSDAPAESFWDDPDALRAPEPITQTVELARRFSLHVEGALLLYNLMLAERLGKFRECSDRIEDYRRKLEAWFEKEKCESAFNPGKLWALMATEGAPVAGLQRDFLEAWSARVMAQSGVSIADDGELRQRLERREFQLKGANRARLTNQARLLSWRGETGVGRMDFRWHRVRKLLADLHRGLGRI